MDKNIERIIKFDYVTYRKAVSNTVLILIGNAAILTTFGVNQYLQNQSFIQENAILLFILNTCNGISIVVLNMMYQAAAMFSVTKENHKYNTSHHDSIILKNFTFQFINSYSPIIFLAFIKPILFPDKEEHTVEYEMSYYSSVVPQHVKLLESTFLTLIASKAIITNLQSNVIPTFLYGVKEKKYKKKFLQFRDQKLSGMSEEEKIDILERKIEEFEESNDEYLKKQLYEWYFYFTGL